MTAADSSHLQRLTSESWPNLSDSWSQVSKHILPKGATTDYENFTLVTGTFKVGIRRLLQIPKFSKLLMDAQPPE